MSVHDCQSFGCKPHIDEHYESLGGRMLYRPDSWLDLDTASLTQAVEDILDSHGPDENPGDLVVDLTLLIERAIETTRRDAQMNWSESQTRK